MKLFDFQKNVLEQTKNKNKVAYYLDMGLGKTFVGAEKLIRLNKKVNLVVCQKTKIDDWLDHFKEHYSNRMVFDLTDKNHFDAFLYGATETPATIIGMINYELLFRRPELSQLKDFTLLLDESSMIQNETAKRTRFILNKLKPSNIILLSGTPTGGKYEKLYSQLKLLGWDISKNLYWNHYIKYDVIHNQGFPIKIVTGYKNVDRLKNKMRDLGCVFMKTDEVFDLPEQNFIEIKVPTSKEYRKFRKTSITTIDNVDFVGDTTLTKLLYERTLCGAYSKDKLNALRDLLTSSDDRIIIFYNFNDELRAIEDLCIELDKPTSIVNGQTKDLCCYNEYDNSVTLIQYQAGSMGLNLQKANKIVYFTPCLSSELFEQSKKRIHRIGQNKNCFYYELICKDSVEEKIYKTLALRKDFTEKLFEKDM